MTLQEDARYEPSGRDSSPPSTRPSSRASSEAETDYSASFDLNIRPEHGLKRYRRFLARAKRVRHPQSSDILSRLVFPLTLLQLF